VDCIFRDLANLAGNAFSRITDRFADSISDSLNNDRVGKYLSNIDGALHGAYHKHHDKYREGLEKLCEFFRRGKLYKAPCREANLQKEPNPGNDKIVATKPPPDQGLYFYFEV